MERAFTCNYIWHRLIHIKWIELSVRSLNILKSYIDRVHRIQHIYERSNIVAIFTINASEKGQLHKLVQSLTLDVCVSFWHLFSDMKKIHEFSVFCVGLFSIIKFFRRYNSTTIANFNNLSCTELIYRIVKVTTPG